MRTRGRETANELVKKQKRLCFAIFYVVIDDLLRMNEMLIIAYELTQIPHTDKRASGSFYVVSFVSTCVYAQIFICCMFVR